MALTQSARLPGPSWDEEVVPALRKRLESESRTLARRMSAVSLSSLDEALSPNFSIHSDSTVRDHASPSPTSMQISTGNRSYTGFQAEQSRAPSNRTTPSSSSRANGAATSSKKTPTPASFQRARTYSQPYLSDLPNGKTNSGTRSRANRGNKITDPSRSSPRLTDIKPTRIPKASRARAGSTSSYDHSQPVLSLNGNGYYYSSAASQDPYQSPDLHVVHETLSVNSSHSNIAVPKLQNPGLIYESAPFNLDSIPSSVATSQYELNHSPNEDERATRASIESEERPFEHWYRGEVSRNGGVGELRVGKRQEMLEIANYGHTIKTKISNSRAPTPSVVDETRRRRIRADSVSGVETTVRERGSLYLDDEHAKAIGRVLDESPLTDLDGEGSDIASASEHYITAHRHYDFMPGEGDISTASAPTPQSTYETRSITPTPSTMQRPSSRQQYVQPTRIPGPAPRQSSESRGPTPTQMHRGASEPPPVPSSSPSPSPPPVRQRQQSKPTPTSVKRGASPASTPTPKKSRTAASKATRAKTLASRKEMENEANRRSVAYYPSPADGEDMMNAIPSWTQPVPREGNWDDVVLPVVARKKGLDGHYEQADGSPQPKKPDAAVEPAPGTFGFDHSKYRPPRGDHEFIPLDEFGRPPAQIGEQQEEDNPDSLSPQFPPTTHEETRLPIRHPPPLSPAPFSDYAPTNEVTTAPAIYSGNRLANGEHGGQDEEDDKAAGCCKCVIM